MLRIEFVNDRTGPDEAANYRMRVVVNGRQIDSANVKGHNRADHWTRLVAKMLAQREAEDIPPLVRYMNATSTRERDAAFLETYAARVRDRTATSWEIPNTVATTLEDIAKRILATQPTQGGHDR